MQYKTGSLDLFIVLVILYVLLAAGFFFNVYALMFLANSLCINLILALNLNSKSLLFSLQQSNFIHIEDFFLNSSVYYNSNVFSFDL